MLAVVSQSVSRGHGGCCRKRYPAVSQERHRLMLVPGGCSTPPGWVAARWSYRGHHPNCKLWPIWLHLCCPCGPVCICTYTSLHPLPLLANVCHRPWREWSRDVGISCASNCCQLIDSRLSSKQEQQRRTAQPVLGRSGGGGLRTAACHSGCGSSPVCLAVSLHG